MNILDHEMKSYDTYELDKNEKKKFLLVAGISFMAIGYVFYHSLILSLIFLVLLFPGLKWYQELHIEGQKKALKEQFRDMLYSLSASLSAGRQMAESLKEAEENLRLIYKPDTLLVVELSYMVKRIFESRESEEELLKDFAKRTTIEDIVLFVDTYYTCRTVGGDSVKVVLKTSEILLDKMTIEKEINTLTAQKRFEAKLLMAIPFCIILFLQMASPDYFNVMFEHMAGRLLMTFALIGIGISYYLSIKLVRIIV